MGFKDLFKKEDNLSKELRMLPRDTKKRILENVTRRRNEILEEKILEKQLKEYKTSENKTGKWNGIRDGKAKRREELRKQGILKPLIRYDSQNFRSPLEEASRKARADEIKRLETQRNKLKAGNSLSGHSTLKIEPLNLKCPGIKEFKLKREKKKNGFI